MFRPPTLLATLVAPTIATINLVPGSCGFSFRAHHESLPPRVPNMLAVRIGQLTARGLAPRKTRSLVGCSPPEGAEFFGKAPLGPLLLLC